MINQESMDDVIDDFFGNKISSFNELNLRLNKSLEEETKLAVDKPNLELKYFDYDEIGNRIPKKLRFHRYGYSGKMFECYGIDGKIMFQVPIQHVCHLKHLKQFEREMRSNEPGS